MFKPKPQSSVATLRRLGNGSGGDAVNNVSRAVDNLAEILLSTVRIEFRQILTDILDSE
jgi:hypothetical protein